MTFTTDTHDIKTLFAAMAVDDVPPSGGDAPEVEEIVAAILSKDHALSAEQLLAFEALLDDPESSDADKQALLQTIWNVVVCIIDHQWAQAQARGSASANACGPIAKISDQRAECEHNLVDCTQSETEEDNGKTAAQAPRRKGRHDGE